MLNDLQERKLRHFFDVFDSDHDGFLEESDFETYVQNLTDACDNRKGSEELHGQWMFVWTTLQAMADVDRDNVVSPKEWLSLADQLLQSDDSYAAVVNAIGTTTFDLLDADGDGRINSHEWRAFFRAHQIDEGLTDTVFPRLDTDSDGFISREETMGNLREFFYSADPEAAGNWFFGPL